MNALPTCCLVSTVMTCKCIGSSNVDKVSRVKILKVWLCAVKNLPIHEMSSLVTLISDSGDSSLGINIAEKDKQAPTAKWKEAVAEQARIWKCSVRIEIEVFDKPQ